MKAMFTKWNILRVKLKNFHYVIYYNISCGHSSIMLHLLNFIVFKQIKILQIIHKDKM